jgi:hypothetical protein
MPIQLRRNYMMLTTGIERLSIVSKEFDRILLVQIVPNYHFARYRTYTRDLSENPDKDMTNNQHAVKEICSGSRFPELAEVNG